MNWYLGIGASKVEGGISKHQVDIKYFLIPDIMNQVKTVSIGTHNMIHQLKMVIE